MEPRRRRFLAPALEIFRQERRLLLDTLLLGVIGALAAQAFTYLLRLAQFVFLATGAPGASGALFEWIGAHGPWHAPWLSA